MDQNPRIRPDRPEPSPSRGGPAKGRRSQLPAMLLQAVPRRLTVAALVYAGVFGLNMLPGLLYPLVSDADREISLLRGLVGPIFILVSLAIAWASWRRTLQPSQLSLLGLSFEVLGTFGIALSSISPLFFDPVTEKMLYVGIPWTCTWLCVYPLIVPTTPRMATVAGILATATVPLAVWLQRHIIYEGPLTPMFWENWFALIFPNVICVALGTFAATMVFKLGREVSKAREMGSYQLGDRLGVGGMGEVWRASHRMLRREAAIKLIRPEVMGADLDPQRLVRRFEREAQATASLHSPHTIDLYDFGTTEEGTFYYVMELLDGIDLESMVERFGPMPPARVIHWLLQACHSLAEAHANGMIHRDVKPANLYVCRYGLEVDFLKVLDFGLVKGDVARVRRDTGLTAPHGATGTPAYMAPEMALGETVDGRADLYSLGCVAYWLLTGQPVFAAENAMKVIVAHVQSTPVPPSQRAELSIDADLEAIVMTCLAKKPAQRPGSAQELAAGLRRCVHAHAWSPAEAKAWWQLHLPHPQRPQITEAVS